MKICNNTPHDGREVRGILSRAAKDLEVYDVLKAWYVEVNTKQMWDCAISGLCSYSRQAVFLNINYEDNFPLDSYHPYQRKDMPPWYVVENWQEALASIAGHEFMHVRQFVRFTTGQKGNHRGIFNEIETQFAEYRAWMREHERHQRRAA